MDSLEERKATSVVADYLLRCHFRFQSRLVTTPLYCHEYDYAVEGEGGGGSAVRLGRLCALAMLIIHRKLFRLLGKRGRMGMELCVPRSMHNISNAA